MNLQAGSVWSVALILVLPIVIILAGELEERLRQRQSPLQRPILIARGWVLPPLAAWLFLVPVLGRDHDSPVVIIVASWLVIAITVVLLAVARIVLGAVRNRTDESGRQAVPQLLLALPRLAIFLIAGWILVAGVWGVNLSAALTALGVSSLVASFALQDTLSGLASGVLLLSDQPFQTGDWINTGEGGTEGLVIDINWRTSRIRTRNGDVVVIPNSELASASIVNYTESGSLHRVIVPVQVAFVNAPTLAKEMLLDAARATPGVLADPPPVAAVVQVDDPLMGYEVRMWIDDFAIEPQVKSDFGSLVWYQSHRHGVPLPSPAQDLYLYDGPTVNEADIPTPTELRGKLAVSPFLASLPDADLDRMAHTAQAARYAAGEVLIEPGASHLDLLVLVEGAAEMVLSIGGDEVVIATVNDGDLVGLLSGGTSHGQQLSLRAVTDCEVIVVDGETASDVGSRHAELASAMDRMATTRRRRIERIIESRAAERRRDLDHEGEDAPEVDR